MTQKVLELQVQQLIKDTVLRRNAHTGEFEFDLDMLLQTDPELYEYFINKPQECSILIKGQLVQLFSKSHGKFNILNFRQEEPIAHLRIDHLDKLVKVGGMISKTTKVVALVVRTCWECPVCGTEIKVDTAKQPEYCSCGNKKRFNLTNTVMQDIQEIELEEQQDNIGDRQPQKIRVRLLEHLTDKTLSGVLQPGNRVEILGIVQKIPISNKEKNEENLFEYRLLAININTLEEKYSEDILSEEDIKQIHELSAGNPLDKLSKSVAPNIFGHSKIKKALILQMVGGVVKQKSGGTKSRSEIHILLCGDAGTAKSSLAKNVHLRMPKSYMLSGDESSKAGLIAMVDKDPLLGTWGLKAGALSKANDSICIIDEMDKLSDDDRQALHTPMESGEILINKADIHTRLRANTSILGIANPKLGMFDLEDSHNTITKQISLPPPLLSRFDLIFVIIDNINPDTDYEIVSTIYGNQEQEDQISIDLFRKYITFAKKLKPKNTKHFKKLAAFYSKVRNQSKSEGSREIKGMPITPRHLEGITRLAEASAKIRLSEEVSEEDMELAQSLFYESLIKLGLDPETGKIDLLRISSTTTTSERGKIKVVRDIIYSLKSRIGQMVPEGEIKKEAEQLKMSEREVEECIIKLKTSGEIYEPRSGYYSLMG